MKKQSVIFYLRIAAVATILMVFVAFFIVCNRSKPATISQVASTDSGVEDSVIVMDNQSLVTPSESPAVKAPSLDTISGKTVEDKPSIAGKNPLENAFRNGLPVLADFGRGSCVPCKMMQPILEKLAVDFAGKATVLILDIREYGALSQKYGITLIPTQIFFDANGEEVFRHQGFMPEQDIVSQFIEMGVE